MIQDYFLKIVLYISLYEYINQIRLCNNKEIHSNVFKIHYQNHLYNIIKQIKYKNRNYNALSSILTWKTSSSFIKNFSFPLFNS